MIKKVIFIALFLSLIVVVFLLQLSNDIRGEGYTYKGNTNADGIEIDEIIVFEKNIFDISQLDIIKNKLVEKQFIGIDIEIVGIKKDILTINLLDKEKYVIEYVNMGSSGSKICSDILQYSFLQPESNIKKWPKKLKILVNGEANVESDHFNFSGVYNREEKVKTLATIKDYGYQNRPVGYEKEYIVNSHGQKFVINPIDGETEIVISEVAFSKHGFYEGEELYRTNKPLLFVMELPEGIPYIMVKLKKDDRTSTWLPTYNGKDGSLIVPVEYEII